MIKKCNELSAKVKTEVKHEVDLIKEELVLNVVQVGEDPASSSYIRSKEKACNETGIKFNHIKLSADIPSRSFKHFIKEIVESNEWDRREGKYNSLLIQLPLPSHIDENEVCSMIPSYMDADGFNPRNIGLMTIGEDSPLPCTPAGVIDILKDKYDTIEGKDVLIINRSNIVGKPLVPLLLRENATVQIAHSRTTGLLDKMKRSDIVITAVGREKFISEYMLSEMNKDKSSTEIIVDVSIMRGSNGKLCGDVDKDCYTNDYKFDIVSSPNGCGPMTVANLMKNIVECYKIQKKGDLDL